ncbi:hypothetical protein [Paenibacillus sp. FSL L8-0463]|uniref:hypothetical protein n=1 Tax=Paenibacillus sp. FSL L8-0463 TaxID=2954687 RepID=UPI00311A739B
MGWSRMPLRGIPNDYNDEARVIDEQILRLVQQRKALSGGRGLFPEEEAMNQLAAESGLEVSEISLILSNLNEARPRRHFWDEPGPLLGVLAIMKTTLDGDFEYMLTHSMQYEKLSIVTLEIKCLKEMVERVHINPMLKLAVLSETSYEVENHGANGGGAHVHMQFMISPPLPEDLSTTQFSLVPGSSRFQRPAFEEVKLDKQIDFY